MEYDSCKPGEVGDVKLILHPYYQWRDDGQVIHAIDPLATSYRLSKAKTS